MFKHAKSNVDVGQIDPNQNGELVKIHKMLLERQQKLARDESEVNSMLQKVTEMLKNQRNLTASHGSQSATTTSDVSQSKHSKDGKHGKGHSGQSSIPEDISSVAKSVRSERVLKKTDKTATDYDNCTVESDDSTPRSRRSTIMTSKNGEINGEDEIFSLTETSDHSDLEERVRKLQEELQREKKKAEDLERKKRKIERSAMKKEALKLETEIKNTKDDIHRKLAEIKTAAAQSTTLSLAGPPDKPHKAPPMPRQEVIPSLRLDKGRSSGKSTGHSKQVSGHTSDGGSDPSPREVNESLTEVLDDHDSVQPRQENNRPRRSKSSSEASDISVRTKSKTSDIQEQLPTNEVPESIVEILDDIPTPIIDRGIPLDNEINYRKSITPPTPRPPSVENQAKSTFSRVLAKDDSLDTREEISEHIDSDSRSTTKSIPEELPGVVEDEESKGSEIPEEISERSYTPIPSDASVTEELSKVAEDTGSKAASVSEDDMFEHSYTKLRSTTSVHERSLSIPESPEIKTKISEYLSDGGGKMPHNDVSKSQSISEHLSGPVEEIPSASDEFSYTEPESDVSISGRSSASDRLGEEAKSYASESLSATREKRISRNASDMLYEDEISQKNITSSRLERSRSTSPAITEDEKPKSHRQDTKLPPTVSERQPATTSAIQQKSSETVDESRKSPLEPVEAQARAFTRLGTLSPRVTAPDVTESHSEASSISEEIASGSEDEDECGSMKDQGLIFGDKLEDENERKDVDEIGLKENILDRTENGLDRLGLNIPGLDYPDVRESGVKASDEIDYTEALTPGKAGNDSSPVANETKESEEYSKSLGSENSRLRELSTKEIEPQRAEDEQQYSEDFQDDDESIDEELSEIAEDSDQEEDFAMFVSDKKASQDGEIVHDIKKTGYEEREVRGKSRETESRAKHALDDITDDIYRDIVADSLNTLKHLKANKLQLAEKTSLDKSDQNRQSKMVLTNAFSNVTRNLADIAGPVQGQLDTHRDISGHESTQVVAREHKDTDVVSARRLDDTKVLTAADRITDEDTKGDKPAGDTQIHTDTDRDTSGQTASERGKQGHQATDTITKDLLADAIMQMIEIKRRKRKNNIKLVAAVDSEPSVELTTQEHKNLNILSEKYPPTRETYPTKIADVTLPPGTTSPVNIPEVESPSDDETAIGNALTIAKTNQILDANALRTIDDDIAGLLGTPLDDEDDFPVNETKFSDIPSDEDEPSLPEYSPMFPVPHSTQELTPMVNSTVDALLEHKRLGRPLNDCVPQAQFLAGETESELECVSIQSYRHLVFDLTKEVFIDTISQHEPASQPPWVKAKWKGGQKLSRNFKRWKNDDEVRAAVLERVTNIIGLGAPRATMATLPRKTPVRGNKKDNVDAILIEELRQEEPLWTDYEEDETTVKFQVADAILNMLLEDTARVCSAIQEKKHVADNVIVV